MVAQYVNNHVMEHITGEKHMCSNLSGSHSNILFPVSSTIVVLNEYIDATFR